jgi:hypothetical protein
MKLIPLSRAMRLFARRVVNIGNRRVLPGQEFHILPNGPGALSWRRIALLYEQRRIVSEADPYFEELMQTHGLENNPEFARQWLKIEPEPEPEEEIESEDDTATSAPPVPPVPNPPQHGPVVEVVGIGGGWYDVLVDGEKVNDKSLRKNDADEMAASYE